MKTYVVYSLLLIFCAIISGCEGPVYFNFNITDNASKQSIDSVLVRVVSHRNEKDDEFIQGFSDSAGIFKQDQMIGMGLSTAPYHFTLYFSKKGYVPITLVDTFKGPIELVKKELE